MTTSPNTEDKGGRFYNEKHLELLEYLKSRQPFKTTYRDIIKNTSLSSIGSVQFGLVTLEQDGLITRTARSTYVVKEQEVMTPLDTNDTLFKLIDDCTISYTRTDNKFGNYHKYGVVDREKLMHLISQHLAERDIDSRLDELKYLEIHTRGPATQNAHLTTKYSRSVPDRMAELKKQRKGGGE